MVKYFDKTYFLMANQFSEGNRIRVIRMRSGCYQGSYLATITGFTKSGMIRIKQDGTNDTRYVTEENIRLIQSQ